MPHAPAVDGAASREGVVTGTPAYMSPEQARGQRVDTRSDVWAFGCVLYEMLTARSAFGRATVADTLAAILEREPDWERLPSNVPLGIRRMLRRCLERDSRRRLHHIADARIEIEDAANDPEGSGLGARDGVEPPPRARARHLDRGAGAGVGRGAGRLVPAPACQMRRSCAWSRSRRRGRPIHGPSRYHPMGGASRSSPTTRGSPRCGCGPSTSRGAHALPGTEGARRPFWSPDSRSIGFFVGSELKRIEARGGSAQTVTYVAGRDDSRVGTRRDHPLLQHRRALAAPRQRRGRNRGGGDDARGGIDRPPPSAVPAGGPAVPVLRRRSGRRARGVSGLARVFRGDASPGVRHARRIRGTGLAAVRPPGNAPGAALRSRTTDAQRRADHGCRLRSLRAHHRHRCVFDIGRGSDGLPGGATLGDAALVVRPIWQRAWHARISRAGGPVESQAVAGWPSRGRRAHAPERDGPVAARFHAPDALYARVGWEHRAPSSLVTGWRSDRVRIGPCRARWRCP